MTTIGPSITGEPSHLRRPPPPRMRSTDQTLRQEPLGDEKSRTRVEAASGVSFVFLKMRPPTLSRLGIVRPDDSTL